jgi:hypothetical protein
MVPRGMPLRKLSAVVLALAALVLAGCGTTTPKSTSAGATGTTTGPSANTRAGFIAQADALCKTAHAEQGAVHGKANKKTTAPELVPLLRSQAQIAKTLATALGKLTAPPGDTAAVGRFVHAVSELAVFSTALANSIHANHAYAARALALKLSSWRQQETLLGQGYGYKVCANGTSY